MSEPATGEKLTDTLHFYFVELGSFNKSLSELGTFEEKVYFCLKQIGSLESRPAELSDKYFEELFTVTEFESLSIEQRKTYLSKMTTEEKHARQLAGALEQGIEQGIEQGLEKGMEKAAISTAKKLFAEGFDIAFISKITDLSMDYLENLLNSAAETCTE